MSLLTKAILSGFSHKRRRFETMMEDPVGHQMSAFAKLVEAGRGTRFGRDHQLERVNTYSEYKSRVPIRRYDDFSDYWDAIKNGHKNVLCAGAPRYWGKTAGTSGTEKYIPIYPTAIAQSRKTFETALLLHLMEHPDARVVGKKILFLGSSSRLTSEYGHPAGFMSSIMVNEFSYLMKKIILPGNRVNHLSLWQDKIAAILEMSRSQDLCIAAAMPPWMLAFFRYAVERTGKPILELWPNLSLLLHSGVSMDSYRNNICRLFGDGQHGRKPSFKNGYGATEGNFAIQLRDDDTDMLLVTDDVFYEFIPLDAYLGGEVDSARISIADVNVDVDYVLVLTTPGGLWSYVIGDTIRFVSLNPHRIRISGRTTQFLNLAGEKLSVDQALLAISIAARKTGASVEEFTLFPRRAETQQDVFTPGHHWVVEFSTPPLSNRIFVNALDESLAELNSLYRVRRQSRFGESPLMAFPRLTRLRPGTYRIWQKEKGKQGGHFKIPRISTNHEFEQELIPGEIHEH